MTKAWPASLLLVAAAALADAGPPVPAPWLSPALGLARIEDAPTRLRQPFDMPQPARLSRAAGGQLVMLASCADWVAQRAHIVGSDTDAGWRVLEQEAVVCDLLDRLARGPKPASLSALPPAAAPLRDTRLYPGTLWVAPSPDEAERNARPGVTLRQASGVASFTQPAPRTLQLRRGDWTLRLTELARADFDGDGFEDLALRWQADTREGTFADTRLVLLTRRGPHEPLRELATR